MAFSHTFALKVLNLIHIIHMYQVVYLENDEFELELSYLSKITNIVHDIIHFILKQCAF